MELVIITKVVQFVVKEEGREVGVGQAFIEAGTLTVYGLNGPKTLAFLMSRLLPVFDSLECTKLRATVEQFMFDKLENFLPGGTKITKIGELNKYGKQFVELEITLEG